MEATASHIVAAIEAGLGPPSPTLNPDRLRRPQGPTVHDGPEARQADRLATT